MPANISASQISIRPFQPIDDTVTSKSLFVSIDVETAVISISPEYVAGRPKMISLNYILRIVNYIG